MDMKKAFIGVGIGVMVVTGLIQSGVIDVNEISKGTEVEKHPKSSSDTATLSEGKWVKVAEKTCKVAWNNKDFKDGWCFLGEFPAGEYRFKVRSSLKDTHTDGGSWDYPSEGIPTKQWRDSNDIAFADFFEQWSPIKNKMIGMVIFRVGDEFPISSWKASLTQKDILSTSINFPATEANWKAVGFHGKISIDILKKKLD